MNGPKKFVWPKAKLEVVIRQGGAFGTRENWLRLMRMGRGPAS